MAGIVMRVQEMVDEQYSGLSDVKDGVNQPDDRRRMPQGSDAC